MPIFNNGIRDRTLPANDVEFVDDSRISTFLDYEFRARSLRIAIFESSVIDDSSWPLVQRLFDAHLRGVKLRTKELYIDAELPQTTMLRYLDHLEKCEVVRRDDDATDNRVTLVSLTESAALWMRKYYSKLIHTENELAAKGGGVLSCPPSM